MTEESYPRDLAGYGRTPPHAAWPGGARIAVQCVLNYEEGAEANVLDGDPGAEVFLSDIPNAAPVPGARHMSMEQIYEYGSRAGVWRLLRLFARYDIPLTVFGVALAMQRNPAVVEAFLEAGHEIASHGWRWINYQYVPEAEERADMARAIEVHRQLTGERPLGWYTGRTSPNTRRLVAEEGGFLYDADDYSDDLPFWTKAAGKSHLIVPYSLETNDMRFASANMHTGDQFFALSARHVRHALCGGRGAAEDDVGRAPLPARRAAGQARRARAVPEACARPPGRLVLPAHRDRASLARDASARMTVRRSSPALRQSRPAPAGRRGRPMRPTISSPTRRG